MSRPTTLTMSVDGITVESDGPIEALDAIQKDALGVDIRPAATPDPSKRARFVQLLIEMGWIGHAGKGESR